MTKIDAYLFFDGRCDEAIDFYRAALGAELTVHLRFRDSPEPPPPGTLPGGWDDKVMHAQLRIGHGTVMASDAMTDAPPAFEGFALALELPDADSARRAFDAQADGGQVRMPLGRTFRSPCFGIVADRFGVGWMVGAAS